MVDSTRQYATAYERMWHGAYRHHAALNAALQEELDAAVAERDGLLQELADARQALSEAAHVAKMYVPQPINAATREMYARWDALAGVQDPETPRAEKPCAGGGVA